jgi:RsiW-degrading membrane proteinase PrsW (M82 family)
MRSKDTVLPPWLSMPVVICGLLAIPSMIISGIFSPFASALTVIPALLVIASMHWLDRLEPEPWHSKVHALLWGAFVAGLLAGIVNSTVAYFSFNAAVVISAPIMEETFKGLGIWWAAKRGQVRTTFDGVIYAGLIGGGFAFAENLQYFVGAEAKGGLFDEFITRGLWMPFAHPFFTLWTGIGIGMAARAGRKPRILDWWGLPLAIGCHAAWNGSVVFLSENPDSKYTYLPYVGFFLMFTASSSVIFVVRILTARRYVKNIGAVSLIYNLTPEESRVFSSWRNVKKTRKTLRGRKKESFDNLHSSVMRLIEHQDAKKQPGTAVDLVNRLQEARQEYLRAV